MAELLLSIRPARMAAVLPDPIVIGPLQLSVAANDEEDERLGALLLAGRLCCRLLVPSLGGRGGRFLLPVREDDPSTAGGPNRGMLPLGGGVGREELCCG